MSLWTRLFGKKSSAASTPSSGETAPSADNRRIRVFISSTFRDMIEERDELMTHTWPELGRLGQERNVELVEADLRCCRTQS